MRIRDIMAALDATIIEPQMPAEWQHCCQCGKQTMGYEDRRAVLCALCTYQDLDVDPYALALQIEFGLTAATVARRVEKYGWPHEAMKEWITPKSKLYR